MGYAGSVLLVIFNLITISNPGLIGLADASVASGFSFVLVGIWWIGFAQITFYYLPKDTHLKQSSFSLLRR